VSLETRRTPPATFLGRAVRHVSSDVKFELSERVPCGPWETVLRQTAPSPATAILYNSDCLAPEFQR
jgi:hypothetical protein